MKSINIKIPIYNDRCHILWPYDKVKAQAWMKKKKMDAADIELLENKDAVGSTIYVNKKGAGAIIFLRKWESTPKSYAVLVHEIVHAASLIIDNIGIDESKSVPETLCYLVDYIFENAIRQLEKDKLKNSSSVSLLTNNK